MTSKKKMTFRLGLAVLMAGTGLGGGAFAQGPGQGFYRETAGDALTRNLRLIADQPRNLSALIGAGRAALELGDPQAALTFFARAEEIAPRDGRVKAGMGAVFVQTEQVAAALQFFRDAASLGAPEAEFAADRGLAYDLSGDPRRAQADYLVALRRQENPEVRRRLALSLAISGERDKALAAIDPQLRAQDRAAWRVRSFILALTGDPAEATRSAEAVMPAQAAQLRPFFAALPRLKPADRASAVHFGRFPDDPNAMQMASAPIQYASAAPSASVPATAPAKDSGRIAKRTPAPAPVSAAPRRRPGTEETDSRRTRQAPSNILAERYGWTGRGTTPRRIQPSNSKPTTLADAGQAARAPARPATPQTAAPAQQEPKPAQQQSIAAQTPPIAPAAQTQPATQPVSLAQTQLTTPPVQGAPNGQVAAPPVQTAPQAQVPAPSGSTKIAPSTFTLTSPGASAPAPTQPEPQTQPVSSIQTTQVPPSQIQPQYGSSAPAPAAAVSTAPALEQPRRSALAEIAAAIESLPAETPAIAADTKVKPNPVQLASNGAAKPAYGPKFETPKAQSTKPVVTAANAKEAKSPATSKKEDGKAAAKKDDAKPTDSKKGDQAKAASAKKEAAAKSSPAKKEEPKAKETVRHWVQIAGGANEAAMNREFVRLKSKAPKLLSSRTAWTTPLKATNRLLVGPFKSSDEAQDFVNELSKQGVSAFSWTSPAGQEIVKLASK